MSPYVAVLLAAAAAAAATDLRRGRIPNVIVVALALAALASDAAAGPVAVGEGLAIAIAVLIAGTLAFARGWMGGGDVKFLAAGCAGLTPAHAVDLLLFIFLAGGVLAVVAAARRRALGAHLLVLAAAAQGGEFVPLRTVRLPYAVAIATGCAAYAAALLSAPFLLVIR